MPIDEHGIVCDLCGKKVPMILIGPKGFTDQLKAMNLAAQCVGGCDTLEKQRRRIEEVVASEPRLSASDLKNF